MNQGERERERERENRVAAGLAVGLGNTLCHGLVILLNN